MEKNGYKSALYKKISVPSQVVLHKNSERQDYGTADAIHMATPTVARR